ncbi:MAG: MotA/TolQ/ExbB proton channel family protein [Verrucomicrobia bacterium]|nr:MotA/TolQ/ExbB proton channel family protein [Verrucomicrobiota bacterium]
MNTKIKPIMSWGIWAIGLSLVMGFVTRNFILAGFRADETGMSYVIAALFVFGLAASFRAAMQLHSEWDMLDRVVKTKQVPPTNGKSGLSDIFNKLSDYKRQGQIVDIHTAIDTYHAGHNSRVRSISIMAALLISMGLLGTIIGLIMAISGLGGMVENIGLSRTTMMEALKATVAGMGTAFYTTFFGALGGLILRAVAVSQLNSLSELCAAATEYADTNLTAKLESKEEELNQQISKVIMSFEKMQQQVDSITSRVAASFETTMKSFGHALEEAGAHAMTATKECIGGMTEQVNVFGNELGNSFDTFNESIVKSDEELQKTFGGLNETIEKSGEGVAESFEGLNASVQQAGETVAGSLADFKLSVDGTSIELNEAVGELHSAISQATGEMITMAQAKLDTEATEIAGQLSLAAHSIQHFVGQKTTNATQQKVA